MTGLLSINKEVAPTRCFRHHLPKNLDLIHTAASVYLSGRLGIDTCLFVDHDSPAQLDPLLDLVDITGGTLIEFPRAFRNLSRLMSGIAHPTRLILSHSKAYRFIPPFASRWEIANYLSTEQEYALIKILESTVSRAKHHFVDPICTDSVTGRLVLPNATNKSAEQMRTYASDFLAKKHDWPKRLAKLHDFSAVATSSYLIEPRDTESEDAYILKFSYKALSEFGSDEPAIADQIRLYVQEIIADFRLNSPLQNLSISCSSPFILTSLLNNLRTHPDLAKSNWSTDDLLFGWLPFASTLETLSSPGSSLAILVDDTVSIVAKLRQK